MNTHTYIRILRTMLVGKADTGHTRYISQYIKDSRHTVSAILANMYTRIPIYVFRCTHCAGKTGPRPGYY